MRSIRTLLCGLLLLALWSSHPATQAPPPGAARMLFEGARLLNTDGTPPLENSAILVENGRITGVGRTGTVTLPTGATRVDLTGKTVMPALVDAHNHIGYQNMQDVTAGVQNYTRENVLEHLHRAAFFGVAAVNSMGYDFGDMPWQVQADVNAGKDPNAARFLLTDRGIATPDALRPDAGRQNALGASTPEEARKDVQYLADLAAKGRHISFVKLWVVGPGGGRFGSKVAMTPAVYGAVIDEAHKHGLRVVVHSDPEFAKDLIRAGVDGFAHFSCVMPGPGAPDSPDAELLAMLKQKGPKFFLMTTAGGASLDWQLNPPADVRASIAPKLLQQLREQGVTAQARPSNRDASERTKQIVQKLRATGITMTLASDAGGLVIGTNLIGWAPHVELEDLVASGLTPQQAIIAGTKSSAEVLGLKELGAVAPGKSADFLVLNANPLDDIANTRTIAGVYLRGKPVDRGALKNGWARWFNLTN